MVTDDVNEEGVDRIPPQGGPQYNGAENTEGMVRRLCLTPAGGYDGRGRFERGGDLRLLSP